MKVLMTLLLLVLGVKAADFSDLRWEVETSPSGSKTITITECEWGASGTLFIPANYLGWPITKIADRAFGTNPNSLTEIIFPETLTTIGDSAFTMCNDVVEFNIPASVTNIGEFAFGLSLSLENINVEASNPSYVSLDGVLLNKDQSILIKYTCPHCCSTYYHVYLTFVSAFLPNCYLA